MGLIYSSLYSDLQDYAKERSNSMPILTDLENTPIGHLDEIKSPKPNNNPENNVIINQNISPTTESEANAVYVITGEYMIGYSVTLKDAIDYVNRLVAFRLAISDNMTVEREYFSSIEQKTLSESVSQPLKISSVKSVANTIMESNNSPYMNVYRTTVYERNRGFLFTYRSIVYQYTIWRTPFLT